MKSPPGGSLGPSSYPVLFPGRASLILQEGAAALFLDTFSEKTLYTPGLEYAFAVCRQTQYK